MVHIGNQIFIPPIILAPLSGCADLAFRLIAREHGARFAFFEMLDANAFLHNHPQSLRMLKSHPKDMPIAAQLLGSHPTQMLEAAHKLLSYIALPFIDINCACPVKKVVKKKAGSYLLQDPVMLTKIIKKLARALPLPVTVKMRTGFKTRDTKAAVMLAQKCEEAGAAALFIHGRTREQAYRGSIDYQTIRMIKERVTIPVWGSGNIFSPETTQKMFDETGCDGILVARGAFGNPWIFRDIEAYLKRKKRLSGPSLRVKLQTLKKHLAYIVKYNDGKITQKIGIMRKTTQWYLTDFPRARKLRDRITNVQTYEEICQLIDSLM